MQLNSVFGHTTRVTRGILVSALSDEVWPLPSFKVFSASGRYVGYSFQGINGYEVYLPGGEEEGWCGSIQGQDVFFSSEELAGRVEGSYIYYNDGGVAGRVEGSIVFCEDGSLAGRIEGPAPVEAVAGAVLLLILNRWYDPEGMPNPALAEPSVAPDCGGIT